MAFDPIAIIGAAARLPGAEDLEAYWDLLIEGRSSITEIPEDRWSKAHFFHPQSGQSGKSYTWAAGVLDRIHDFDPAFFGISPREAIQIDPQQRLLLELTAEALEDAGAPTTKMAGSKTGVYIGASGTEFGNSRIGDPAGGDAYFMLGTTTSIAANRLSYIFDLHGPSFVVDTACSSSLVALHLACAAIREGEVDMALAGGVNMLLTPYPFVGFCAASMLSPDGRCFAFDERANGYVRSEGAGVVLLKPLAKALADGDAIRAVIVGDGINSDGRTMGMSLPSGSAQATLLRSVYEQAGVSPNLLSFVEAHGTGTAAGDPIELGALSNALAKGRPSPLLVGSAKTNLGHLEVASGMAGLFKAMLAIEHRTLPPSINFETPSSHIDFDEINIQVATKPTPLGDGQIYAGVNSFGFGGANGHVVLTSAPEATVELVEAQGDLPPLLISARSKAALDQLAEAWAERLEIADVGEIAPLIRGAARRRDHLRHRLVAMGETPAALAEALRTTEPTVERVEGQAVDGKLAFVFTGNGSQWEGMGRDALQHSRPFRDAVVAVDALLQPLLGWSVVERLRTDNPAPCAAITRTDVAQPLLFAVQIGIVAALREQGIEGQAFVGHSVGEVTSAWAAGALTLEAACRVIVARCHHQQRTEGRGRMAALMLAPELAQEVVAKLGGGLELAAVNSDTGVTVAGPASALERLKEEALEEGWRYTPLDIDYAFHSAVLDFVRDDLIADLSGLHGQACKDRFVSSVTGETLAGDALDPSYWWDNIRKPVDFRGAIKHLAGRGFRIFLEVGPRQILQSYIRENLKSAEVEGRVLPSLGRQSALGDPFPLMAAKVHVAGGDMSSAAMFGGPVSIRDLPRHPWMRDVFKAPQTVESSALSQLLLDHPLIGHRPDEASSIWRNTLDPFIAPWISDHALEGVPLLPAAGMAEIGLALARSRWPDAPVLEVQDLDIFRSMPFETGQSRELRTEIKDDRFEIASRTRLGSEPFGVHAVGRIGSGDGAPSTAASAFHAKGVIQAAEVYAFAEGLGLNYGPAFRTVAAVEIDEEGSGQVRFDPAQVDTQAGYILQPSVLDGALQGFLALLSQDDSGKAGESLLPVRLGSLRAFGPFGRRAATARIKVVHRGVRSVRGEITLHDADGVSMAELTDCWFQRVTLTSQASPADRVFSFALEPAPRNDCSDAERPNLDAILAPEVGGLGEAMSEAALLFDAYLAVSAQAAVEAQAAGLSVFTVNDLLRDGKLAEEAAPLFAACLRLLADHGLADEAQDGWRLTGSQDLGQADVLWRTLLDEQPALVAELALTAGAYSMLNDVFEHGFAAQASAAGALLDQVLYGSPTGRAAMANLVQAIGKFAKAWPENRPLRILEIGSGSTVLEKAVKRDLILTRPSLTYQRRTLDETLETSVDRFDLVVSAYGLTRLYADGRTATDIAHVLATGGAVLAVEPEPNQIWDLLLGQDARWWAGGRDPARPVSSARPLEVWAALMEQAGLKAAEPQALSGLWPSFVLGASKTENTSYVPEVNIDAPIILISERVDALTTNVEKLLAADGADVRLVVQRAGEKDFALREMIAERGDNGQVVVLPTADALVGDIAARLHAVTSIAKAIGDRSDATLWVVTKDAQTTAGEAAVWGLGRTLMNEAKHLHPRLIDLASDLAPDEAARALASEIAAPDHEREIVLNHNGRSVMRLRRGLPPAADASGAKHLLARQPGRLDSLTWTPLAPAAPGPGQVAIDVRASGLNFRDVMWAQGLLPEEALMDGFAGPTLGLECAGIVTALGEGVTHLAVGDRVMAFAPAALSDHVVTAAHAAVGMPDAISFEEGATVPVAYLTVLYALGRMARLREGETILIHGGAGGVGQAAIQYAHHCGATVIATAGSPVKREFLRQLGVAHVLNSRSLAFADDIRALTGGKGVDVVLNSLSGEAMEASMRLLAPFGRFLELGKRDFYEDTRVGLRPLRRNASYFAIDADSLPLHEPKLAQELLEETVKLMDEGVLRPLPYRLFSFTEVVEAFRLMQGAGHIGKIVLSPDPKLKAPDEARAVAPAIRSDATYLVTGGLSGFGLATAEYLVTQGAEHLALMSRTGSGGAEAQAAIARLEAQGVSVRAFACDVADAAALDNALTTVRTTMPGLAGIFHCAMVLDDGLLFDMTAERFETVLSPKVRGAANLDAATRVDSLDLFVLYSSATTLLGAPGQGAYVAANMALEAIAAARRRQGLPGLAVGWGPIGDAGFLARQAETLDTLSRRLSATPLAASEALGALPMLIESGLPAPAYAAVQWDSARRLLPILASPAFAGVSGDQDDAQDTNLAERLAGLSPEEKREAVTALIREEVAKILSSAPDRIDINLPLPDLGMDSLMAVELRLTLEGRLGVSLPLLSLGEQTTLVSLAGRIVRMIGEDSGASHTLVNTLVQHEVDHAVEFAAAE